MRKINSLLLTTLLTISTALSLQAQELEIVRGDCTPLPVNGDVTRGAQRKLPSLRTDWDPERVYRQMVVLVAYSDYDFQTDETQAFYNRMFNERGFAENGANGCIADYFRDQSGGLFNLEFDVYGPIKTNAQAKSSSSKNYATTALREATRLLLDSLQIDCSVFDWDDNKTVDQVIYITAGPSGNASGNDGYLWPNTSSFSSIQSPDGYRISNYSVSAERFTEKIGCGLGTICHEFSHCLGLPDIYPVSSNQGYSVADEWDLMDGGNFTRNGWCPVGYTPTEKMLLGWLTPIELDEPVSITGLKPVTDGGEVYQIRHTDNEFYLLENRQWTGWDAYLPGKGLVIYHVDYNRSAWSNNSVNNSRTHRRFQLVCADNMDYDAWDKVLEDSTTTKKGGHSLYLSGAAYPYEDNNLLTDDSTPASVMFNNNADNSTMLSKAITNIKVTDDGLVSFDFRGGDHVAISEVQSHEPADKEAIYNLQGMRIEQPKRGLYVKNGKKIIIHSYNY